MKVKKTIKFDQETLVKGVDLHGLKRIDGRHPLQEAVDNSHVIYRTHTRPGGEVLFFNFELAREMGLVSAPSELKLSKPLIHTLLQTFSLEIINEYDMEHGKNVDAKDIRANGFMATRYLQLQHPDKTGKTSGDGRSIWNGVYQGSNGYWDISSCGTGATCLSPATAIEKRYFHTGDPSVSYGCGRASAEEGLAAAFNSEVFHHNGIPTERTLLIIGYSDGSSINVRAAQNLLRPAHMFRYLKQNNLPGLKQITDYYITRQKKNGHWPRRLDSKLQYEHLLTQVTTDFARMAAVFESEYIFCWLDWDGDNILMNGGVIDYGSIRQFGLFHRDYRYNDVDRMSTNISSQKHKAKYICQVFAQLTNFLQSGRKKPLKQFRSHASQKLFNRIFRETCDYLLLYKIGFSPDLISELLKKPRLQVELASFRSAYEYFERKQASYGTYEVNDGITSDAIYCLRDILRELPVHYLGSMENMEPEQFIQLMQSDYAMPEDVAITPYSKRKIRMFQHHYKALIQLAAELRQNQATSVLQEMAQRSAQINRYERVTGDAVIGVTAPLMRLQKRAGTMEMYRIFANLVEQQILRPEYFQENERNIPVIRKTESRKILQRLREEVKKAREGI